MVTMCIGTGMGAAGFSRRFDSPSRRNEKGREIAAFSIPFGYPLYENYAMVTRRKLKDAHEQAVVAGFIAYSNKCGYTMTLIDRPDPPDAVIDVDGQRTWLEITDAWMDQEYARHHTTWASDDVAHVPTAPCRFGDINEKFQQILSEVIKSKYENIQLQNHAKQHGQGTLLVGIFTPFALAKELAQTEKPTISQLVEGQPIKPFDNIFLYDGFGERSFYLIYHEG